MEKTKKSKKQLIEEAQVLADEFNNKKEVIITALNDLDSKEKIGTEHLIGMSIIEEIFKELDQIKVEQDKIFEQIKKS